MPDVTITAVALEDSPADYDVPPTQEIIPKLASASYDGSGAGGDYIPTLQLVSPDLKVVGSFPFSTAVPAGESVDIAWFRGGSLAKTGAAAQLVAVEASMTWGATSGFYTFPSNDDGVGATGTGLVSPSFSEWLIELSATYAALSGGAVSLSVFNPDTVAHSAFINWATVQDIASTQRQKFPVNPAVTLPPTSVTELTWGASTLPNTLLTITSGAAAWTAGGVYNITASILVSA